MEDLLPTVVPGQVGLRDKKTGKVSNHFPVDAREIMTISKGVYELIDNGAVEAARINANPLKALEAERSLIHSEVTGIEGQVLVAMSPEQAEEWRKKSDVSGTRDPVSPASATENAVDGQRGSSASASSTPTPSPTPAPAASAKTTTK